MDMTKVVTLTKTEFFQALRIWILGFWLFWVWLQPDGFRAQCPLRGIPLCWLMLEIGIELASSTIVKPARAFTGRRCPHSGKGEDFLTGQLNFFTETAVTPERKVEKSFPMWEINRHAEG